MITDVWATLSRLFSLLEWSLKIGFLKKVSWSMSVWTSLTNELHPWMQRSMTWNNTPLHPDMPKNTHKTTQALAPVPLHSSERLGCWLTDSYKFWSTTNYSCELRHLDAYEVIKNTASVVSGFDLSCSETDARLPQTSSTPVNYKTLLSCHGPTLSWI